ncbi:AmpG family muropeptide MFS transporter [Chamaesiphon sp. OTE_75_metabat_556]|uniref:AmpG family muropeptide MFS transporter n=1 Tax=Chamaesiphon sp. OTE_75_metabat_556 TaxID=2964692 RepID=UPI002869FC83|nr:MFS transporter [Chamaesiphon sp. OTE_75_metabat_556]
MKASSFLDIIRSRKMVSLLILGFASGLPAQALEGPLQLWLKEQKVDPLQITEIGAMATFPYAWKFIWSPFLDRFVPPLFDRLGRRQSWLLLTQSILILLLLLMSAQNPSNGNLGVFTAIAIAIGFFSASQDIVSDAYRTDVLEKRETGTGAALWTNGFRIAVLIAGNLIIGLADEKQVGHWSWPQIYLLIAGLLALSTVVSLWAPKPTNEERNTAPTSLSDAVVLPFEDFIDRKKIAGGTLILMFILTYKLGDYMVKSVAKLFLKDIGFSATDIGNTGSIGIVAAMLGAIFGGLIMLKIGMNRSLWIAAIGLSIGILPYELLAQIAQPNINLLLFAVSGESFAAGLEASVFVAFMMSLCNPRFSATQFALFSSFMLAGKSLIVWPMGGIYQGLGGSNFFWISIFAAVPSLLLLLYVAPLNIKKLLVSGSQAQENNDLNTAIDRFSHAIDLDTRNGIALTERSLLRAELGKKISDRGASYPEDISAKKIDCYQDAISYYQGAIEDCHRAIEIDTTTNHLSEELIKIKQGAKENLDRAIEITPNPKPNLYNDRATINFNLGDLQIALADSDRSIDLDDKNAKSYLIRGKIRERLGDRVGATADLDRSIELDPKQPDLDRDLNS